MTSVFDECERNFYTHIRQAQRLLATPKLQSTSFPDISQSLQEASAELNKMEIEYSSLKDPSMRAKIGLFKQELKKYKKEFAHKEKANQEYQSNSDELIDQQRMKQDQLGVNPLIQAKRQMYQNEALSNEAALGIKRNNQILLKGIHRMDDINNELTVAQKVLGSIKQKMRKNRFILYGTGAFLFAVVIFIIYTYVG